MEVFAAKVAGGESVVAEKKGPKKRLTIDVRVNRSIHSVTLDSSGSDRVKLTTDGEVKDTVWEEIGCQIIRLCELGCAAEAVGLTKEDIAHLERHFIIRST